MRPPRSFALAALIPALILATPALAAQAAGGTPDLQLRGDRFKPLTYGELNPAQKAMADNILAGARGRLSGPYNVLLRSPEMGDLAQNFGAYTRFRSVVPKRLNEFAILIVARHWTSQYEWTAHKDDALAAGLSPAVIAELQANRSPGGMQADEAAVYAFCQELLNRKQVSDATFARAKALLGEQGVVDLIGTIGYYQLVSMLLNVDRYPLPEGAAPELRDASAPSPPPLTVKVSASTSGSTASASSATAKPRPE
jgi:4-carboxymuconolactone decarboxylase